MQELLENDEHRVGLLEQIERPDQLRSFTVDDLFVLAQEIRQEIITTVARRGGHLAPNLGTVELTLALHLAFDAPRDRLVWDIGHQAYTHKLITGRRREFATIKQLGGLSGYLRRDESIYDAFGGSHASTSISAALGMAIARDMQREDYHVVAIIGDGALTGGMALEAINHAGSLGKRLMIVLNDNGKSISDNTGAMHLYLERLYRMQARRYDETAPLYPISRGATHTAAYDSIFAELGFTVFGPIDGHDIEEMKETFGNAKAIAGPVLVHVRTQKGRGCAFAVADPTTFHGPGAYDPLTGILAVKAGAPPKYQDVFANTLIRIAQQDERIVGITAAMAEGTSLYQFKEVLPDRFLDVGICEQHAVTLAAGLACEGMLPVLAIYSSFLQRAYDQIIHDICIQNLHVVFALDRAGLVGEDGQTQHGIFDIGYLRMIPAMRLMAPKDENELQHMLYTALSLDGPVAVRYPRGSGLGVPLDACYKALPVGKAEILTVEDQFDQSSVVLLAYGTTAHLALQASRELEEMYGLRVAAVNARWAKPLDEQLLRRIAANPHCQCLLTIEDGLVAGGFGSAVAEFFREHALLAPPMQAVGLPDRFIEHGPIPVLHEHCGISVESIKESVLQCMSNMKDERNKV